MFFQTLDDKTECVGVYVDGKLHFDEIPDNLTKTWKYTGSVSDKDVEFAWLYANGLDLQEAAPEELKTALQDSQRRFRAYLKAFKIGKINLREHCFFDLVPQDFLMEFCDIKNQVTEHVFDNFEKPENYKFLDKVYRLLHKIKYQDLNLNNEGCRELYYTSMGRKKSNQLIDHYGHIDYNLFGTVTGRLTTLPNSFPILTVQKNFRQLLKPHNDWFISLDYNGAEARTLLYLNGESQPQEDIHTWNMENIFISERDRDTAKTLFFAWLYNPESSAFNAECYNREKVLDEWYRGGYIYTPYDRKILVDERKALNYLIQSSTADRVLARAVEIDEFLEGKKSFISHIVHDEIVIDMSDEDRESLVDIKQIFEKDNFMANLNAGKDYFNFKELKI